MSIQEAIDRGPLDRKRIIFFESDADRLEQYRLMVEKKGMALFKRSGIARVLADLKKIIGLDYPDVEPSKMLDTDRAEVIIGLRWDFVREKGGIDHFKAIRIHARILTGEIVVERKEDDELLSGKHLRNRTVIEDAIAAAYRDPLQLSRFGRHY